MMTQSTVCEHFNNFNNSSSLASSSLCRSNSQSVLQAPSSTLSTSTSTMSSSKSCNLWINPQDFATWIDNEVNSLVHDLKLNESQQKLSGHHHHNNHHHSNKHKQPNNNNKVKQSSENNINSDTCKPKEGKKRWLSVSNLGTKLSNTRLGHRVNSVRWWFYNGGSHK